MTVVDQAIPQRPRVVALGVPFLALVWAALAATVWGFDDFGPGPWTLTAIWCWLLYRVWRGGLFVIAWMSYFLMLIPALLFAGSFMLIASWHTNGPPGPVQELPVMIYVGMAGWVGAIVVGVGLRRPEVRAWCLGARRPMNRDAAPSNGVPAPAATEPVPTEPVAADPPQPTPAEHVAPAERLRLMLPITQGLHRATETAMRDHRPDLWLGWFQRTRSDSPWFMR